MGSGTSQNQPGSTGSNPFGGLGLTPDQLAQLNAGISAGIRIKHSV